MSRVVKFPNGFDVTVVDKHDILQTINDNILDKEVLSDILSNLETDMCQFLREGRWTGVPFLGNIRVPKYLQVIRSEEAQELIEEARVNLNPDKYRVFRRNFGRYVATQINNDRFYNYTISINVNRYKNFYKHIKRFYGRYNVRFYIYSASNLDYVLSGEVSYEQGGPNN